MSDECAHAAAIRDVTPSALGCEECLKIGSPWLHLRLCPRAHAPHSRGRQIRGGLSVKTVRICRGHAEF
jgi:hypothetical protein